MTFTALFAGAIAIVVLVAVLVRRKPSGRAPSEAEVCEFLDGLRVRLSGTRRPVARISLEPLSVDDPRTSKVGGRAFLPGVDPPRGSNGRPLVLLAQISWAEVELSGYPSDGLLQFWIAADRSYGIGGFDPSGDLSDLCVQRDFRVLSWPASAVSGPAQEVDIDVGKVRLPHDLARPKRIRFEVGEAVMSVADFRFDAALGEAATSLAESFAAARGLDPEPLHDAISDAFDGAGHKLGGYPSFTQDDPRSEPGLELLLQLDSADGLMWGDAGIANFFISSADLVKRRFDRVMYTWDCT